MCQCGKLDQQTAHTKDIDPTVRKSFEHVDAVSYLLISDQTDMLFLLFLHLLPQLCGHISNKNNNWGIINTDFSEACSAKQDLCLVS